MPTSDPIPLELFPTRSEIVGLPKITPLTYARMKKERWKGNAEKDGEGPRRIWFTAVNFPTEIAIPTAFPALWFASMSYSCCFIVSNACTVQSPRRHHYE